MEEIDWSTGKILEAIKQLELDERTLVVWTSDNGAPRRDPPQGSNKPLRGWGYTTMEAGMRVPCIVRWPGKVPAGSVSDELATMMDWLPTFAHLAGGGPPTDRTLDGHNIWHLLSGGKEAKSPYKALYYYQMDQLQAIRAGKWKLHLALAEKRTNFRDGTAPFEAELYDLDTDIGETTNLAANRPEVVARLTALADGARRELGDRNRPGENQRPGGRVARPEPRK